MHKELREVKLKRYRGSLILKIALVCFVLYIGFLLVSQRVSIREKEEELDLLSQQVRLQEIKNQEMEYALAEGASGETTYAEKYARSELGYAKQGERVFVNIGGN